MVNKKEFINKFKTALGYLIEGELIKNVPVNTGSLKASIETTISKDKVNIAMLDYWKYIEYGTPPHIIRPVNAKALKFSINGDDVFAKEVHHPGTRPQPFIRPMLRNKLGGLIKRAIEVANG